MKKIEIKTEKATLLVVDLTLETTKITAVSLSPNNGIHFITKDSSYELGFKGGIIKTDYQVKHLGKVSEITEEEWKCIVDDPFVKGIGQYVKPDNLEGWAVVNAAMGIQYQKYSHISFKDYQIKSDGFSIAKQYPFETATESGLSLLKANGVDETWSNQHVFIKVEIGN